MTKIAILEYIEYNTKDVDPWIETKQKLFPLFYSKLTPWLEMVVVIEKRIGAGYRKGVAPGHEKPHLIIGSYY